MPFRQLTVSVVQLQSTGVPSHTLRWMCKSGRRLRSLPAAPLSPWMGMWILLEETGSAWASCPTCTEQKPSREQGIPSSRGCLWGLTIFCVQCVGSLGKCRVGSVCLNGIIPECIFPGRSCGAFRTELCDRALPGLVAVAFLCSPGLCLGDKISNSCHCVCRLNTGSPPHRVM